MKIALFFICLLPLFTNASELDQPISNQEIGIIEGNLPSSIIIREDIKSGDLSIATSDEKVVEADVEGIDFTNLQAEAKHELDTLSGSESFYIYYGYNTFFTAYWGNYSYAYRPYYHWRYRGYRYTCYSWRYRWYYRY